MIASIDALFSFLSNAIYVLAWFFVPVFLIVLWWRVRLIYKRAAFLAKVEWVLLEMQMPANNEKTPKAMEQVFASLYGMYSFGVQPLPKYLEGKVDLWASFEMMGKGGEMRFFVRFPSQYRNLVESAIYSQYPDVELEEVIDYMEDLPTILPNDVYDIFGTGFGLTKNSVYPIRTYFHFEDPKEERRLDPLSSIVEAMSKLKNDETAIIQVLFSPTGALTGFDLKKKAEEEIQKIVDEKSPKRTDSGGNEFSAGMIGLSEGYRNVVKDIEAKAAKLAFQVSLRFLYIDRKDSFSPLNNAAIMGSFQQFNTVNENAFKPDKFMTIFGGWKAKVFPFYKRYKLLSKKRRLYDAIRTRRFGYSNRLSDEGLPVLNVEELATLFHFPSWVVKAPSLRMHASRKSGPPTNLPIEE